MELTSLLSREVGRNLFLPAHGRGKALPKAFRRLLKRPPGYWDLPELPCIGSPLDDQGAVAESQRASAEMMGVANCWYGVNGATGLLQAGLFSMLKPGQAVLMPRNVHKSLINACLIGNFLPVLFDLPFLADRGHYYVPNYIWLEEVLAQVKAKSLDLAAAVLVNPTYHGYSSDIKSLIMKLHSLGLPVLVDEAHGSHFFYYKDMNMPESAISAGADIVVNSLHKSSLGLSQTAVIWLQGDKVDYESLKRSISLFQTSSPSALLLSSCELAIREWENPSAIRVLKKRLKEVRKINNRLRLLGLPLLENKDPFKLILHTASVGINGVEADAWMISKGLVAELPEPGCITFCLGFGSHKGVEVLMKRLWNELSISNLTGKIVGDFICPPVPLLSEPEMNLSSAWKAKFEIVPLTETEGRISAEMISPYPPGISFLIPGERIDSKRSEWLIDQHKVWPNQIPPKLKVVI